MSFHIEGLDPEQFRHLNGLSEEALARLGVERHVIDTEPGVPDRIEMRDVRIGETALLLNYEHLPVDTPYRSRHAIFVREGAERARAFVDEVPESMRSRVISLRAFDGAGAMVAADLAEGPAVAPMIEHLLAEPEVAYLHAHYAKHGCYAARITRA